MAALGKFPFVRPLLALTSGISLNYYVFPGVIRDGYILFGLFFILLFVSIILNRSKKPEWKILSGFLLLTLFVVLGFLLTSNFKADSRRNFASNEVLKSQYFLKIQLLEPPLNRTKSWRATCKLVSGLDSTLKETQLSGKIQVYWSKSKNAIKPDLGYGDLLVIANKIIIPSGPAFPEDFSYAGLLRKQNVNYQAFLKPNTWLKVGNSGYAVFRMAYNAQFTLLQKVNAVFSKKASALLASLLLGDRSSLDQEDLDAFSKTGTMHILAVSGLHVGLLYLLILLVFTRRRESRKLPVWQSLLVLLILWSFAFITGLSNSVIRAVLMFTILELGRSFLFRQGSLINSLFVSAFIQLVINPFSLFDIGFQLSYLAVLGIAVVFPWANQLWQPTSRFFGAIYQSALLSLCATVATLPVTLYYFQSFPVWFIPANLFILPVATLLIYAGIAALLINTLPIIGGICVLLVNATADLLMFLTAFFSKLPFARLENLYFSIADIWILSLFLLFTLGFLINKSKICLYAAVICCLLSLMPLYIVKSGPARSQCILSNWSGESIVVYDKAHHIYILSRPLPDHLKHKVEKSISNYCRKTSVEQVNWKFCTYGMNENLSNEMHICNGNPVVRLSAQKHGFLIQKGTDNLEPIESDLVEMCGKIFSSGILYHSISKYQFQDAKSNEYLGKYIIIK